MKRLALAASILVLTAAAAVGTSTPADARPSSSLLGIEPIANSA